MLCGQYWLILAYLLGTCYYVRADPSNIVVLQDAAVMEDLENEWQKYWHLQLRDWQNRYRVQFTFWRFTKAEIEAHTFGFNNASQINGAIFITNCNSLLLLSSELAEWNITTPVLPIVADECLQSTLQPIYLSSAVGQWPCFATMVASWLEALREVTAKKIAWQSSEHFKKKAECVQELVSKTVAPFDKLKFARKLLTRAKLNVTTYDLMPFQMRLPDDKDGNIQYTGVSHDIFNIITNKYQVMYTLFEPPDKAFGASINGTWNGMEMDVGVACFVITYGRAQKVDYTWPFFEDPTGILIPPPQEETKLWACAKPFDTSVWLTLICMTSVMGAFLWIIMALSWKYVGHLIADVCKPVHRLLSTQYLFLIGVVFSHANVCPAYSHSSRIIAAAWCLGAVVLVNVYTSMLISFLTIPKIKPMADSIEDVAYNGRLMLTVWKSSSYDSMILGGISGAYRVLGETLRQYPEHRVPSTNMGVQKVLTGKYAYIIEKLNLEHIVHKYWKEHSVCRLTIARHTFANSYIAFTLPKRSPYLPVFNDEIRRFHETGLIKYWGRRAIPPNNPCFNMLEVTPSSQSLKFYDLQSAFLVMGTGIALALTVFALEVIVKPLFDKKPMLPCTCFSQRQQNHVLRSSFQRRD